MGRCSWGKWRSPDPLRLTKIGASGIIEGPVTPSIDWNARVHRSDTGALLEPRGKFGEGQHAFRGFEDPAESGRGWLYYNEDGSPFRGAPAIENAPGPVQLAGL